MTHRWQGVTEDRDNKAHTHTMHIYLPLLENRKDENRKMWKL